VLLLSSTGLYNASKNYNARKNKDYREKGTLELRGTLNLEGAEKNWSWAGTDRDCGKEVGKWVSTVVLLAVL